ncbi:helix-turn-helix domain-containing protein [Wenyingzhuangia aestuarii]|uniref:helix-turn-helix domain-containing protein n=1 Tax=Wenyingzhuangia aestuarii TaxID=1647582 RepID=UPI001ADB9A26|nr:AraC family transcriptional regulator [Wenyingzhuangia aestuarii]
MVKKFNKDLTSLKLEEKEWVIDKEGVVGCVKDIQLNKIYILFIDIKHTGAVKLSTTNSFPLFKLHFQLDGNWICNFKNKEKSVVDVLKGMYNLFYIPESKAKCSFHQLHQNSIEIFFTEALLQNIMGYCFTGTSQKLKNAKLKKEPYPFFKGGVLMNEQLVTVVNDIVNCSFRGVMKKAFLEAKITELLLISLNINAIEVVEDDEVDELDKVNLKEVEKHIRLNLKKELTIPELSLLAGMNTSKLKKSFKQLYGTTIFKYITSLRIEKAKELIQKEKYTIAQASYEVGYKNPQHFTVAFKKMLGYLPSQLKKHTSQILYMICLSDFEVFFI